MPPHEAITMMMMMTTTTETMTMLLTTTIPMTMTMPMTMMMMLMMIMMMVMMMMVVVMMMMVSADTAQYKCNFPTSPQESSCCPHEPRASLRQKCHIDAATVRTMFIMIIPVVQLVELARV